MLQRLNVLFLCTGNSCRSQMAEGFARALHGQQINAYSAGIVAKGLNPLAVAVMAQAGVDISGQTSKTVAQLEGIAFDLVITVCGHAQESCPTFPGKTRMLHVGFDDPPALAAGETDQERILGHYRRVRDEIRSWIQDLPQQLLGAGGGCCSTKVQLGLPRAAAAAPAASAGASCCGGSKSTAAPAQDEADPADKLRQAVRQGYAAVAVEGSLTAATGSKGGGCCGPAERRDGSCGGWSAQELAGKLGYQPEQIAALPEGANMGLSCGNPTAIANLKPGQVVLDLGSGGGFDCYLAGPKVGPSGRVIGVDMTPEMLAKARGGLASYRRRSGLDNVEFRLGEIEHLPVADASVDVVISNCVINLSPNKEQVWREIARVLRPGGQVAASDIALLRPLPQSVRELMTALVGCVAGAVLLSDYQAMIQAAGLASIQLRQKPEYVAALESFQDPLYAQIAQALPAGATAKDFVTSVDVHARKPAAAACCVR